MSFLSLNLVVEFDKIDLGYGKIIFPYKRDILDVGNVNLANFRDSLQSICYSCIFHKICGVFYIEDTDLCGKLECVNRCDGEEFIFSIMEGNEIIFLVDNVNMLTFCREVGLFSELIYRYSSENGLNGDDIGRPNISFSFK